MHIKDKLGGISQVVVYEDCRLLRIFQAMSSALCRIAHSVWGDQVSKRIQAADSSAKRSAPLSDKVSGNIDKKNCINKYLRDTSEVEKISFGPCTNVVCAS